MIGARIFAFWIVLCTVGVARADDVEDALFDCDLVEKLSDAIICYSDIVVDNPNLTEPLKSRGFAYLDNGQYDLAIADLQRAIGLDPKDDDAYWILGIVYEEYGKFELAVYNHSKAIELNPLARYYADRARAFFYADKTSQGLPDADMAVEMEPKNANYLHLRGEMREALGDTDGARQDYEAGLALDPKSEELKKHLNKLSTVIPAAAATYDILLCNKSGDEFVYAAIGVYATAEATEWTILAWYEIPNGSCKTVATREFGKYDKVDAAIYAESDDHTWSGDYSLCLDPDNSYERLNQADYSCRDNEELFKFYTVTIARDGPSTVFTQTFK